MTALPKTLDAGDGLIIDRDLALKATRHILIAVKLLLEIPTLQDELHLDLAETRVSDMLGGDHWLKTARQLIDAVLEQEVQL